jgi:enoyl-CoA hydratase
MTQTQPVSYELSDGVANIRMDDGKVNVMSESMSRALIAAFDRAEADKAVVLLSGRERVFSAGYDLGLFQKSGAEIAGALRAGGEAVARIFSFPYPVVAAATGHVIAQGAFVLLGADVRLGAQGEFKIGMNEVAIGLTVPHYALEIARARLSVPGFDHAAVTGSFYAPEQALALGFFHAVHPHADVLQAGRQEALRLTKLNMPAHAGTKRRVRATALAKILEGIEAEFPAGEA